MKLVLVETSNCVREGRWPRQVGAKEAEARLNLFNVVGSSATPLSVIPPDAFKLRLSKEVGRCWR